MGLDVDIVEFILNMEGGDGGGGGEGKNGLPKKWTAGQKRQTMAMMDKEKEEEEEEKEKKGV